MGLAISWIAAEGVGRGAMLGALGLAEAGHLARGHPVPPPAKLAAFELGGWVFVVSPDSRFASRERVSAVSQAGSAVGAYSEPSTGAGHRWRHFAAAQSRRTP